MNAPHSPYNAPANSENTPPVESGFRTPPLGPQVSHVRETVRKRMGFPDIISGDFQRIDTVQKFQGMLNQKSLAIFAHNMLMDLGVAIRSKKDWDAFAREYKEKFVDNDVLTQIADLYRSTDSKLASIEGRMSLTPTELTPLQQVILEQARQDRVYYTVQKKIAGIQDVDQKRALIAEYSPAKVASLMMQRDADPRSLDGDKLPKLTDILLEEKNVQELSLDYYLKILNGAVEYHEMNNYYMGSKSRKVRPGRQKAIVVEGREIGKGGMGGTVSQNLLFDASPTPHHTAMKRMMKIDYQHSPAYEKLEVAKQMEVDELINTFTGDDLFDIKKYFEFKNELNVILFESRQAEEKVYKEIYDALLQKRLRALETRNIHFVMRLQAEGQLKDFVTVHCLASDGSITIMESLADPETGKVESYKSLLEKEAKLDETKDGERALKLEIQGKIWASLSRAIRAFAELHKHSLVHRDPKPSNFGYTHTGRLKVLDFDAMMTWEDMKSYPFPFDSYSHTVQASIRASDPIRLLENLKLQGCPTTETYYDVERTYEACKELRPLGAPDASAMVIMILRDILRIPIQPGEKIEDVINKLDDPKFTNLIIDLHNQKDELKKALRLYLDAGVGDFSIAAHDYEENVARAIDLLLVLSERLSRLPESSPV